MKAINKTKRWNPRLSFSYDEPLLSEISDEGKIGYFVEDETSKRNRTNTANIEPHLLRTNLDFPNLSEPEVVRHFTRLSRKNHAIDLGMYPLGSCTMKYNPKINEQIARIPEFLHCHPLSPTDHCQGSLEILYTLERYLCAVTGMDAFSLQPCAGAQGEMTGMKIIWAYHKKRGSSKSKVLVPDTAHGTNPATAALCDYEVVQVHSNKHGRIDLDDLKSKLDSKVACIMITNPNTLGIFEVDIAKVSELMHKNDALVYMDGANFNAILGIADVGKMGVDVMHLNLHKTLSTPHGGGGPGAGPVGVRKHLAGFLPTPHVQKIDKAFSLNFDTPDSIGKIGSFWGNFSVCLRALSYLINVGNENLRKISEDAVVNANYIKARLKKVLPIAYEEDVLHEVIFSDQVFREYNVSTMDVAKRLLDYGIHPPTVYFPLVVRGAMMLEPTETESKLSLDYFVNAMKEIVEEIKTDPESVKNAPHHQPISRLDEVKAARTPLLTDQMLKSI
jgi:glycine dehydrogenase subunit 2